MNAFQDFQRTLRSRAKASVIAAAAMLCLAGAASAAEPTVIHSFSGGTDGSLPYSPVMQASDGYLYGTTYYGTETGTDPYSGYGLVYRTKLDGSGYRVIHVFNGTTDGGTPIAPLIQGKDGALYGVAFSGAWDGPAPNGTIYKISKKGKFSVLHTFNGTDGAYVDGAVVQDPDTGVLYGVGQGGGTLGWGTIYSMSPDGSNFKVLHNFDGSLGGGTPKGSLTIGTDGRLYGVGNDGGGSLDGVVYSIAKDGSGYKVLHQFAAIIGEGHRPNGKLVQGPDGYFYGTTNAGGKAKCYCGTVFRVNAAGDFATVHSFSGDYDGSGPSSGPILGANGNLYGTTFSGGASGFGGTAWQINTKGKLAGLQSFTTFSTIETGLVLASDGMMYGTSLNGGGTNVGVIYRLDPALPVPPAKP